MSARAAGWRVVAAGLGLAALVAGAVVAGGLVFLLVTGGAALVAALGIAWRLDPAWALSGGVALAVFSGHWDDAGLPGFPVVPDRLLLVVGVLALALGLGRERSALRPSQWPVVWVLALTACYAIGSAVLASSALDSRALFDLLDRLGLVPFAMFAVAALTFDNARRRAILLVTLTVLGGYLGLTAFAEAFGLDALVFPRYILDPGVGFQVGRARGPFAEAAANGLGLYACTVAAAIACATWRRPAARAGAAAVVFLCAAGQTFTLTRSIWAAGILATTVTMLSFAELRRRLVPVAVGVAVLVPGLFAVVPGLYERAGDRYGAQVPIWDRRNTNAAAINMIEARPLFGFGWESFETVGREFFELGDDYPQTGGETTVHNVFLSHAAELGLVGAGLWTLGLALAVGGAIVARGPPELRPWRIGLVALAVHWVVVADFVPLPYAFPNLLLWTWAGVVYGGARQPRPT